MSLSPTVAPLLITGSGAILVYLLGRLFDRTSRFLALVTAAVLATSLASTARLAVRMADSYDLRWPVETPSQVAFLVEPAGILVALVVLGLTFIVALYSGEYIASDDQPMYYYPLLLLIASGMIAMAMSADLFTLYLSTLLASVTSYVLVAFRRHRQAPIEAGFKYLVMGSAGAMLTLTGIALLYRVSGTTLLAGVRLATGATTFVGRALVVSGFAIKSALVPAHTWLPDAHGEAPSSISAVLSGILIEVNLYAMIKAGLATGWPTAPFGHILVVMGILNMIVGNAMALRQRRIKRLLAYSSIAQVGYVLVGLGIGIADGRPEPAAAGLFLLTAHAAMKGLAFLCVGTLPAREQPPFVTDLAGLAAQGPWASGSLALAVAALAGIPPLAGFTAKWHLAASALGQYSLFAAIGLAALVLNTLLAFGYYLPVIVQTVQLRSTQVTSPPSPEHRRSPAPLTLISLGILSITMIAIGFYPQPLWGLIDSAAVYLINWSIGP